MTAAAHVQAATLRTGGASLTLRHLGVEYGDKAVLRDLTLDIAPGERVALVGASGGGKTTLLRALAGLTPHRGDLAIRTAAGTAARVRVMFQEDRLLPWLGALDNAALGLGRAERHFAAEALEGVGLGEALSGEQRQTEGEPGTGLGGPGYGHGRVSFSPLPARRRSIVRPPIVGSLRQKQRRKLHSRPGAGAVTGLV
ncbi:ATP-binding cassette domain-containing protein, partial [uncultured Deinococcus sp.]|uniref:ATP-binding cassette domain-containing protein n=1 Tax=uncultured Deinococcus sp. TaxID=158789 RepID=UPI003748D415